jgi:hypothetical protein
MFESISVGPLLLHQNEPIMFCWVTGVPNERRTPDEFYAVRVEVPADASVGDYHDKMMHAFLQLTSYLIGPPPEFMR